MTRGGDRYPLDPVRRLRDLDRKECARAVREAAASVEARARDREDAEAGEARIRAALDRARDRRTSRARAGCRAGDVQAGIARESALAADLAAAAARREKAREAHAEACLALEAARGRLERASAGSKAIEKHRDSWALDRKLGEEKRREEDP